MESTKDFTLSDMEKDAVGEIANMCMGSAATALSTVLGRTVAITTPEVNNSNWKQICNNTDTRYVCVRVNYSSGMAGSNVVLFDEKDALKIANIMIGMEESSELTELEISAMGEITNQMIGASTTTLSNIIEEMVDISPPDVNIIDGENAEDTFVDDEYLNGGFIQVKFKFVIEGLVDSYILQVFPNSFAEVFVSKLENSEDSEEMQDEDDIIKDNIEEAIKEKEIVQEAKVPVEAFKNNEPQMASNQIGADAQGMAANTMPMGNPMMQNMMGMQGMPYMYMPNMAMAGQGAYDGGVQNNVNVQAAQFTSFVNNNNERNTEVENIDLIMDVPLEVTVELGRTNKSISEILEFKPGTIVELNKVAGDPIDILVNGKLVAVGEVVVIDENFGIRIVDIIK